MAQQTTIELTNEAKAFGHYVVGHQPSQTIISLYKKAVSSPDLAIDVTDQKLLAFVHRYPYLIGLIDAGLPFYKPYSEVRRRLYLILAIMEASPDHYNQFMPQKRSFLYIFAVMYFGILTIIKTIVGSVLVRIVAL